MSSTGSSAKKARKSVFSLDVCIFCSSKFTKAKPACTPKINNLDHLFEACRIRRNEAAFKLLDHEPEICNGTVTFRYHKGCRATFAGKSHLERSLKSDGIPDVSALSTSDASGGGGKCIGVDECSSNVPFTRAASNQQAFDWKRNCFICGEQCSTKHRSKWSMVESSIGDESNSIFQRVMDAAKERNDQIMMTRLQIPNQDLVAVEARYHRAKMCLCTYVNISNVQAEKKMAHTDSAHKEVLSSLVDEIYEQVMNENCVYELSTLRSRYCEIAEDAEIENPNAYTAQKLKQQLKQACPDFSFFSQKGRSDLVCSSYITVRDALVKARSFNKIIEASEFVEMTDEDITFDDSRAGNSEESIIHNAMQILKRRIKLNTTKLKDEYYSSCEMTLSAQKDFVDPLLHKAIGWLADDELLADAAGDKCSLSWYLL